MNKIRRVAAGLAAAVVILAAPGARAVLLEIVPSAPAVTQGQTLDVDVLISGLTTGGPPSLGGYDITVLFDTGALSAGPADVSFGSGLGFTFPQFIDPVPDGLRIEELSLEAPGFLDLTQPDTFRLFTISFTALAPDPAAQIRLGPVLLSDAFANRLLLDAPTPPVTVVVEPRRVPAPVPLALLAPALVLLVAAHARRRTAPAARARSTR